MAGYTEYGMKVYTVEELYNTIFIGAEIIEIIENGHWVRTESSPVIFYERYKEFFISSISPDYIKTSDGFEGTALKVRLIGRDQKVFRVQPKYNNYGEWENEQECLKSRI